MAEPSVPCHVAQKYHCHGYESYPRTVTQTEKIRWWWSFTYRQ